MTLQQALAESMMGPFDEDAYAIAHHHDRVRGNCVVVRASYMIGHRITFRNEDDIRDPWKGGYVAALSIFDWEPLSDISLRQQIDQTYHRDFHDDSPPAGDNDDTTTSPG